MTGSDEFLWTKALQVGIKAKNYNALIPLSTKLVDLYSTTKNFELRYLTSKFPIQKEKYGPKKNPFQPWDKLLEIQSISNSHVLILNKYPVQEGHMLLITKHWQPQNGWLNFNDFSALINVENDTSGLWFFNSCIKAGASQPHRHIQLLPRQKDQLLCPRDYWFKKLTSYKSSQKTKLNRSIHVISRDKVKESSKAINLYDSYLELCERMIIGNPHNDNKPLCPYNLLITPNWISLIRRSKDRTQGFSINALGFAGYFLATGESNINLLINKGPNALLKDVVSTI